MTSSRTVSGHVRPVSSRGASVAHDIVKRRDRRLPHKKATGTIRNRKLPLSTIFRKAPSGWTFVPVGTPELSNRCKELSRTQGFTFSIVNTRNSGHAMDPGKLSHHVHRAGYHFKSEIVEQACEDTGYELSHNVFVKTADLREHLQRSHMAQVMAKFGFRMDEQDSQAGISDQTKRQVTGAIRELFPNIPDYDVDTIVTHAWKKGSNRVGTHTEIPLPRRVQLAVVACIRHKYTDYDRLLKAFGWSYARSEVEQDTLSKLIEWRGDDGEDAGLEEVVREAIVIGSDTDDELYGSDGDDNDDSDAIDVSDASIEVTHHQAADHDFGAESADDFGRTVFPRYQLWPPVRDEQHSKLARDLIESARQRIRNALPSQTADIMPVSVPMDEQGLPPNAIIVDGKRYERAAPVQEAPPSAPAFSITQPARTYADQHYPQSQQRPMQPVHIPIGRSFHVRNSDTVVPSIEPHLPVTTRAEPYSMRPDFGPPTLERQLFDERGQQLNARKPSALDNSYSEEPYDPRQPMVQPARRNWQGHLQPDGTLTTAGGSAQSHAAYGQPPANFAYPNYYVPGAQQQPPPPSLQQFVSHDPSIRYVQNAQPVHGAPAPVQQSPYYVNNWLAKTAAEGYRPVQLQRPPPPPPPRSLTTPQGYQSQRLELPSPPPPPINGAPHPAQYFQRH